MFRYNIVMSNVSVYEIVCNNESVQYKYVDYTTNYVKKKYFHKHNTSIGTNLLYRQIRENGGWDNWQMRIVEVCDLSNVAEVVSSHTTQSPEQSKLVCDTCNYSCVRSFDYDRHCETKRHKAKMQTTDISMLTSCIKDILISNNEIVKSNQELQQQIVELSNKQPIQQITNNIVQQNTQNNTSFNIQVFLDEKCGDAMNLSAFLKTLAITNEDLVRNTEVGFVAGMSAIIKREMCDKLPVNKRPVHCTDIKRETVYYRENDKWHKEEGKVVEEDMMYQLTRDCLRTYTEWRRVHPDTKDIHSKFNLLCDRIPSAVVGGLDRATVYPKTMREIYKHCLIDKKNMR